MVKMRQFMMVGMGGLLVACAQQQAPVVSGFGQQQPRAVVTKKASPLTPGPLHTDEMMAEPLAAISPAAGPISKPVQVATLPPVPRPTPKPVAIAAPEPEMIFHTVTSSDTGYKLARTYNTTIDRILKDNGMASMTEIREGQVLTIAKNSKPQSSAWDDMKRLLSEPVLVQDTPPQPQQVAQVPVAKVAEPVVVQAAPRMVETVPPKLLAEIEPAAGERPKDDGVSYERHTVQPKETIYRISLKYNVSVLDIMAANDFSEPQDLKADSVIRVPVKKSITQQLIAKTNMVQTDMAQVSPAAGNEVPVVVATEDKPVQVALLSPAPQGASEAQKEDLETKAVKQQALKDATLPEVSAKVNDAIDAKAAEQKRGQVDPIAARAKGLVWPVKGQVVRKFGDDGSGVARTGINIAVPKGTPVLASEGGKVLYADDGLKIYGKLVLVRHDNGMVSAYAHNGYLLVGKNERVKKGQVIALSGASGNVESPQLHFELRQHASAVDPIAMLPRL